jgi:pimeloyl-ACP methyl ester carboxylesterase
MSSRSTVVREGVVRCCSALPVELTRRGRQRGSAHDQDAGWAGIARWPFVGWCGNHRGGQRARSPWTRLHRGRGAGFGPVIQHLVEGLGPFAPTSNDEPITKAACRDKPSWFISGQQDYMLLIDLERDTAQRMGAKILVLPSSHVPMISHPGEVADFIENAAAALS